MIIYKKIIILSKELYLFNIEMLNKVHIKMF